MITKEERKKYGLPLTRPILYFPDRRRNITVEVVGLAEEYKFNSGSCILEALLEDGDSVNIHSDYLKEMQSISFVADLQKNDVRELAYQWFDF